MTIPPGRPTNVPLNPSSNPQNPSIPQPPDISDFKFTTIGKPPKLLARFSSPDKDISEPIGEPSNLHSDLSVPEVPVPSEDSTVEVESMHSKRSLLERIAKTDPVSMEVDLPEVALHNDAASNPQGSTHPIHSPINPSVTVGRRPNSHKSAPSPSALPLIPSTLNRANGVGAQAPNNSFLNLSENVTSQPAQPNQRQAPENSDNDHALMDDSSYSIIREIQGRLRVALSSFTLPSSEKATPLIQPAHEQCTIALSAAQKAHSLAEKSLISAQESVDAARECINSAELAKSRADEAVTALEQLQNDVRQSQQKWNETLAHTKCDLERLTRWVEHRQLEEEIMRLRQLEEEKERNDVVPMDTSPSYAGTPDTCSPVSHGSLPNHSEHRSQLDAARERQILELAEYRRAAEEEIRVNREKKERLERERKRVEEEAKVHLAKLDSDLKQTEEKDRELQMDVSLAIEHFNQSPVEGRSQSHHQEQVEPSVPTRQEIVKNTGIQGAQLQNLQRQHRQKLVSQELNPVGSTQLRVSSEEPETSMKQGLLQQRAKEVITSSGAGQANTQSPVITNPAVQINTPTSITPNPPVALAQPTSVVPVGGSTFKNTGLASSSVSSNSRSVSTAAGANRTPIPLPQRPVVQIPQQGPSNASQSHQVVSQSSISAHSPGSSSQSSPSIPSNIRQHVSNVQNPPLPKAPVNALSSAIPPASSPGSALPSPTERNSVGLRGSGPRNVPVRQSPLQTSISSKDQKANARVTPQSTSSATHGRVPVKQESLPDSIFLESNRTAEVLPPRSAKKGPPGAGAKSERVTPVIPMLSLPSPTPSSSSTRPTNTSQQKPQSLPAKKPESLPHRPPPARIPRAMSPVDPPKSSAQPTPAQFVPVSAVLFAPVPSANAFSIKPAAVSLIKPSSGSASPVSVVHPPPATSQTRIVPLMNGNAVPLREPSPMGPDLSSGGWNREPLPPPIFINGDRHAHAIGNEGRHGDYYSPPFDHVNRRASSTGYNQQRRVTPPMAGQKRHRRPNSPSPSPPPQRARLDDSSNWPYFNGPVRGTPEIYARSPSPGLASRLAPASNRNGDIVRIGSGESYRPVYNMAMDGYVLGEDSHHRFAPAKNQRRGQQPQNNSGRDLLARMGGDEERAAARGQKAPRGGRGNRGRRTSRRGDGNTLVDRLDL